MIKKFTPSVLIIFVSIIFAGMTKGQNTVTLGTDNESYTLNDANKQQSSRVEIVINMEMIESFRRCYDKIEVISWADMFRDLTSDDSDITWMAYKRIAYIPSADSISYASLPDEKEKIRYELKNGDQQIKSINAPVSEEKLAEKSVKIESVAALPFSK